MPHGSQVAIISYAQLTWCALILSLLALSLNELRFFSLHWVVCISFTLFSFRAYLLVYTFLTFAFWPLKSLLFTFTGFFPRRRFFLRFLWSVCLALFTWICFIVYRKSNDRIASCEWLIRFKSLLQKKKNRNDVFLSALFRCCCYCCRWCCFDIYRMQNERKNTEKNIISEMEILAQCTTSE